MKILLEIGALPNPVCKIIPVPFITGSKLETFIFYDEKPLSKIEGKITLFNKEVYDNYSRVLLISDINSKIPVRVGKNNKKAIISGNNTTKIDLLYLKENMSFESGDLVYTSGDGGYFNPGIPIGVIKKENNTIYINPFNDLSEIQYINIFLNQFKNF